jgi:hypothetical protein
VLVFIMGLGLLASAVGTAKIFPVKAIDTTTDPTWQTVRCDVLRLARYFCLAIAY